MKAGFQIVPRWDSRETVVGLARFHDNCRCVGIEVKDDSQLPQINRDLEKLWKEAGNKAKFDELINSRRTESGGKPTDVKTPRRYCDGSKTLANSIDLSPSTMSCSGRLEEGESKADTSMST